MIRRIKSYDECRGFVSGFQDDPHFSDPTLCSEEQLRCNLIRSIAEPERHFVFGIYREAQMIGLFSFLVSFEEQYMEMLVGLSREKEAYTEMLACLEQRYPGYSADFVFNPENFLLKELLEQRKAAFEPEQQKMRLVSPVPGVDTTGVELLSDRYAEQYCAMHTRDVYWTGERVLQAQNRFRTLLAIQDGKVAGYIDVTYTFQENEPFDLLVLEEYRRRGHGRRLLAKALEMNAPNGMLLHVDVENAPAICLYEAMGFARVPGQNSLSAHWRVARSGSL